MLICPDNAGPRVRLSPGHIAVIIPRLRRHPRRLPKELLPLLVMQSDNWLETKDDKLLVVPERTSVLTWLAAKVRCDDVPRLCQVPFSGSADPFDFL